MTSQLEDLKGAHPFRQMISIVLAALATAPGIWVRFAHPDIPHPLEALLYGFGIVGAAFLLSWAAEVAQLDISAGLAIAVLALIAVLPEYAVDLVFGFKAGNAVEAYGQVCKAPGVETESPCSLALANMTGSNRLLIGIGWSMVVFLAWYRVRSLRRRREAGEPLAGHESRGLESARPDMIELRRANSVEVAFLAAATIYSLTLPLKHTITLVDMAVLVGIFIAYAVRIARAPAEEPHLVGPAQYLGGLSTAGRRASIIAMFAFSGAVIILVAEPFAEALVATGESLGISEFLLVQWLAPLASESPELLVAGLYAWRLYTLAGLGTLVSSKVNQWTLLVGTLPIVFAIASSSLHGLPIEPRQREELFITAAQSFFAVAVLASLSISTREALLLFVLFWTQFIVGAVVPESWRAAERIGVGAVYMLLGIVILARDRSRLPRLLRDGFRTPYSELQGSD